MRERFYWDVERFRDGDNKPTCAANFEIGDVCMFLGDKHYGTVQICMLKLGWPRLKIRKSGLGTLLNRRKSGLGTLIPSEECPFWKDEIR